MQPANLAFSCVYDHVPGFSAVMDCASTLIGCTATMHCNVDMLQVEQCLCNELIMVFHVMLSCSHLCCSA